MKQPRHGFTLLELLIVMGIMVILMTIAAASYGGIRRGAEIRGAAMALRTTLMLSRQEAVTKRKTVTVNFVPGATPYLPDTIRVVSSSLGKIYTNSVVPLPLGIQYSNSPPAITFKPSGSAMGLGSQEIIIVEKAGASSGLTRGFRKVQVWFLTGITKELP